MLEQQKQEKANGRTQNQRNYKSPYQSLQKARIRRTQEAIIQLGIPSPISQRFFHTRSCVGVVFIG
uniref:Uncharacterized protein MANES_11G095300 n=1 Tax=Rhizophora mucronata TaxID=61149 RepID=A0A2P2IZY4_RHIMU